MPEIWKEIKNYEGFYAVSSYGNVKSLPRKVKTKGGKLKNWYGGLLKPVVQKTRGNKLGKYLHVGLSKNGKTTTIQVHQLVAEAFLPNFVRGTILNHIDGNPSNNHISNLEISNDSHNMLHAVANGLKQKTGKTSKYNNVSFVQKNTYRPWVACISYNGNQSYGWKGFGTEEEAALHVNYLLDSVGDTIRKRNVVPTP